MTYLIIHIQPDGTTDSYLDMYEYKDDFIVVAPPVTIFRYDVTHHS